MKITEQSPDVKPRTRVYPCLLKHLGELANSGNSRWKGVVVLAANFNTGAIVYVPKELNNTSIVPGEQVQMATEGFNAEHWQEYFGVITLDNTLDSNEVAGTNPSRRLDPQL